MGVYRILRTLRKFDTLLFEVLEQEAGVFEGLEETESGVGFRPTADASLHNKVLVGTWSV
jgi:hypothetical protein